MKDNFKLSALFGSALGLLCVAGSAQAQVPATQPVQKPITIKLGAYFPTASSGRDAGGNTEFSAGVDYAFAKTSVGKPILPSVYFDYQGGNHNGGHSDSYGLGVAARYYTSVPGASVSPYFGAGIGIYDESLKRNGGGSSSNANLGAKLMAGVEFSSALVELNYQFLPKHNGVNPDGLGLQVGYRF